MGGVHGLDTGGDTEVWIETNGPKPSLAKVPAKLEMSGGKNNAPVLVPLGINRDCRVIARGDIPEKEALQILSTILMNRRSTKEGITGTMGDRN